MKSPGSNSPGFLFIGAQTQLPLRSARSSGKHAEERLDVRVGPCIAVGVKVGGPGAGVWAAARKAGEERFDVRISPGVAVTVEVDRAAAARNAGDPGLLQP